jgi:2-hydroxy-3-keto-5-methylthiopentenyl-1-phosphate phosphatase
MVGWRLRNLMNVVVLCDFDGTVTTVDTAEWVLTHFAQGDWKLFERQFERGEITINECLTKEFSLVKASKEQMLKELNAVVIFRPNFKKLAEHCREKGLSLTIVSAGLDFVIRHFLRLENCLHLVEVCTPKTIFNAGRISFIFPKLHDESSVNFKQDVVNRCKNQRMKTVYIGDGQADFPAVKDADVPFVIQGSRLAGLCSGRGILCKEITDFQTVIEAIEKIKS